jgi:hypothetical protein
MWPEMHQESIPTDLARQVADEELGRDDLLLPEEVIDAFGWTPELGPFPGPPPPGPSLDFDEADMRRLSRKAARNSHRGPADAEQGPQGPGLLEDLLTESPSADGRADEEDAFDDQPDGTAHRGSDATSTPGAPTPSGPTAG